jgi:two-component system response regulator MtrA
MLDPTLPVLVIEHDESTGERLVDLLRKAGFAPTWVRDPGEAVRAAVGPYLVTIVDLSLPGALGPEVLRHLRERSDAPVLALGDRHGPADTVRALALGADDYLAKPFHPEELLARVQARLRRPALERNGTYRYGELLIDLEGRQVVVRGKAVELTRVEFELLAALARRPGAVLTRRSLLDNVLDPEREGTERTLDVHISRLRKKLGPAGRRVATVWGVGYRFDPAPPPPPMGGRRDGRRGGTRQRSGEAK